MCLCITVIIGPVYTVTNKYIPVYTSIYQYIPVCSCTYPSTGSYWYILVHTSAYQFIPVHTYSDLGSKKIQTDFEPAHCSHAFPLHCKSTDTKYRICSTRNVCVHIPNVHVPANTVEPPADAAAAAPALPPAPAAEAAAPPEKPALPTPPGNKGRGGNQIGGRAGRG